MTTGCNNDCQLFVMSKVIETASVFLRSEDDVDGKRASSVILYYLYLGFTFTSSCWAETIPL